MKKALDFFKTNYKIFLYVFFGVTFLLTFFEFIGGCSSELVGSILGSVLTFFVNVAFFGAIFYGLIAKKDRLASVLMCIYFAYLVFETFTTAFGSVHMIDGFRYDSALEIIHNIFNILFSISLGAMTFFFIYWLIYQDNKFAKIENLFLLITFGLFFFRWIFGIVVEAVDGEGAFAALEAVFDIAITPTFILLIYTRAIVPNSISQDANNQKEENVSEANQADDPFAQYDNEQKEEPVEEEEKDQFEENGTIQ